MARILFTWELGGGLGHVVPYLGIIEGLQRRGHNVAFALRDPTRAGAILAARNVRCLQAPIRTRPAAKAVALPCTYADILYNCGFDQPELLRGLVEAWRGLFELAQPDMVIFNHSPTALLAARAYGFTKTIVGTGFLVPPDVVPLPNLRPSVEDQNEVLRSREEEVLSTINTVMKALALRPLNRVAQIGAADLTLLCTFRELDHYPERIGGEYWGCAPQALGQAPAWPAAPGKRIFVYLKSFNGAARLLSALCDSKQPTIVYGDGLDPRLQQRFSTDRLVFASSPLDIRPTAAQCDCAVLHATHNTTSNMLLTGRPMLQVPLTLEQALLARAVERLHAGIVLRRSGPTAEEGLKRLLEDASYAAGAKAFAGRYADWSAQAQEGRLVNRLDKLLSGNRKSHESAVYRSNGQT